ncbi:hypothetical protein BGW80DRAFT_1445401 [Lactifluus volemus]|nr:hypothetical protein BGW80DRAFT_1445401 [Lactifluus volemus]
MALLCLARQKAVSRSKPTPGGPSPAEPNVWLIGSSGPASTLIFFFFVLPLSPFDEGCRRVIPRHQWEPLTPRRCPWRRDRSGAAFAVVRAPDACDRRVAWRTLVPRTLHTRAALDIYDNAITELRTAGADILVGGARYDDGVATPFPIGLWKFCAPNDRRPSASYYPNLDRDRDVVIAFEELEQAIAWNHAVPQGLSSSINVNVGTSGAEIGGNKVSPPPFLADFSTTGPVEDISEPESGPVPTANKPFLEPAQVEAPASAAFKSAPETVPVEEPAPTAPEPFPGLPVEESFAASAPTPHKESALAESTIPTDTPEEAAAQQLDAPLSSAPTAMPSASGVNGHTKSLGMGSASTAVPTVDNTSPEGIT